MSFIDSIPVENGTFTDFIREYECDMCRKRFLDCEPHSELEENDLCLDCSYLAGNISKKKYLDFCGIDTKSADVFLRDGEIIICIGKPPWEKTSKDIRSSGEYARWRTAVYERDNFVCQKCGQVGGDLNAHHVKPFAKFPDLRFDISNGQTLCETCHKNIHRRR
ncbi:HNH endonuclease [Enterococcus sp. AZ109]|uniref:HNH endonuclease n=1 Tax=Enterococcus sp. AZ109 TaxID=2774634 RepID=UPI003F204669